MSVCFCIEWILIDYVFVTDMIKSYLPSELHTIVTFLTNLAIGVPQDDHAIVSQFVIPLLMCNSLSTLNIQLYINTFCLFRYSIDSITIANNQTYKDLRGRYNFWILARFVIVHFFSLSLSISLSLSYSFFLSHRL